MLEGFRVVSQSDQFSALHDLEGNIRIFRQGTILPTTDTFDKFCLDNKVGTWNPSDFEEIPHPDVMNPLGHDDFLVDTTRQEVLVGISRLIASK